MSEIGLRNDVYRRPLATALDRLGISSGWKCVDVGAGAGDVSIALAEVVGRTGRVYSVDINPEARDLVAAAASSYSQVVAITQAAEDLLLPELVDLAFCRFLLMHVADPSFVLSRMRAVVRAGGFIVAQEPITSAGRIGGKPISAPAAINQDVGCFLPRFVLDAGLEPVDMWAEAPAGIGAGPVASYLASITGVDPGDEPIVLPPLVTVIAKVIG